MDVFNLEEELDPTVHTPQGDQGQVNKVQKGEDPEAHQPTQDFWKTPDVGPPDQTVDITFQPATPQSDSVG